MVDASLCNLRGRAASNSVDLRFDVGGWLSAIGGALLCIVSTLAASKTGVVAATIL